MDTFLSSPEHHIHMHPWIGFILGLLMIWAGVTGGWEAFQRGRRKTLPKQPFVPEEAPPPDEDWRLLCERADLVVEATVASLPEAIRGAADQVPCVYKERAEKESVGYRRLGEYHNFIPGRKSDHNGPIVLFLKSIEEWCSEIGRDFDTEVKFVYLHELGHHFGWDEVDLARHGLPSGKPPWET